MGGGQKQLHRERVYRKKKSTDFTIKVLWLRDGSSGWMWGRTQVNSSSVGLRVCVSGASVLPGEASVINKKHFYHLLA